MRTTLQINQATIVAQMWRTTAFHRVIQLLVTGMLMLVFFLLFMNDCRALHGLRFVRNQNFCHGLHFWHFIRILVRLIKNFGILGAVFVWKSFNHFNY
jgi:hypothetical protein